MATIDIIILIIIGAGAIVGFMKGFIRQLASILGLIVGLRAVGLAIPHAPSCFVYHFSGKALSNGD